MSLKDLLIRLLGKRRQSSVCEQKELHAAPETNEEPARAEPVEGVLFLYFENAHSEWALQDKRFILPNTTRVICRKCFSYWEQDREPNGPTGTRCFPFPGTPAVPPDVCPPDQHDYEPISPETWTSEGFHVLRNGDQLTVYDKADVESVVWSGTVHLRHYSRHQVKALDCWIRSDQEGLERDTWARWFFDKYPGRLAPARRKEPKATSMR